MNAMFAPGPLEVIIILLIGLACAAIPVIAIFATLVYCKQKHNSNLIPCPDCGRRLSPLAKMCPNCGRPVEASQAD